jgi:hypothetical protein
VRETKETTIDGTKYRVTQLGALAASRVMLRLGNAIKRSQSENVSAELLTDDEWEFCRSAFADSTSFDLAIQAKAGTVKQALSDHFDEHFAGKPGQMLQWFAFALKANFGDFLAEIGTLLAEVGAAKPNPSSSPKASIPRSGESS